LALFFAGAALDTSRPENKQKHKKYKRMSKTLNNFGSIWKQLAFVEPKKEGKF
jgi:hypothetical protein